MNLSETLAFCAGLASGAMLCFVICVVLGLIELQDSADATDEDDRAL